MNSPLPSCVRAAAAFLLTTLALRAESPDELIAKGDTYYAKLQAQDALKYYLPAERLDPKNVRLLVKISREYRHEMSDASSPAEKLKLGTTAINYAKRAVSLAPNDPEAQLAVGISYGKLQPLESNGEKIQSSRVIKAAADKTLALDPSSDLAWHLLGRWNAAYAGVSPVKRALAQVAYGKIPVTTYEDAAKCFEKAIELKPDRLMHYIELGRVYAEMGRTAEARKMINKGLAMRETEKDDPETKQLGRETLQKLH